MRIREQAGRTVRAEGASASRVRRRALVAIAAALALIVTPFVSVAAAQAATHTFVIDSLDATPNAADNSPGDGVCLSKGGACTLRAALEESNALNLGAGQVLITVADGLTGNIDAQETVAGQMLWARVSDHDHRALFAVTAPVIIDLRGQITTTTPLDGIGTVFHIDGPDIQLRNANQILSGRSSIVVSPRAVNFTLDGGSSITQKNYFPERFMTIREGATNVTVQNYRVQGFYNYGRLTGLFYINAQNNTPVRNLVINNVQVTYTVGGACNVVDGTGCRTHLLQFTTSTPNVVLEGFTFTNSFVSNMETQEAFRFARTAAESGSVKLSDLNISNNQFINVRGAGTSASLYNSFIALPVGKMGGTNVIQNNQFVRSSSGQGFAITWNGRQSGESAGDLTIANNYFNGYTRNSIYLRQTGDVRVERNTFGARSASQGRPAEREEERNGSTTLLQNYTDANNGALTWFPNTDAAVLDTEAPAGAVQVASPLGEDVPVCVARLSVQAPTSGAMQNGPVDLDLYWTEDRTAEIYLGRAERVSGSSATLLLDLPIGEQVFPSTVVGQTDSVTIVDADSGAASGHVRLQTLASDGKLSSQYSRIVGFSGNCRPELTINQTDDQNDPTLARDLHYLVKSSLPLDAEVFTPEVVDVAAAATEATIDAERLNPRIVSVEPVAGKGNKEFVVIAHADDSADVTANIGAEKLRSIGGLTNRDPAATRTEPTGDSPRDAAKVPGNEIRFVNPIVTRPDMFTLVMGEPDGQRYGFDVQAGAPVPTSDLNFTAELDAAGQEHGVELSASNVVLKAGATKSERVLVSAKAGEIAANTPVGIAHSVVSEDPNYAGLLVRGTTVRLFSTDPSVRITKRAFVDVDDRSSPEQIMATGVEALSGTRLMDGQAVCFVYEVSNISADDWATVLTDITVTDTDSRLGADGVIGRLEELAIGESALFSACGTLIPVDTTVSSE